MYINTLHIDHDPEMQHHGHLLPALKYKCMSIIVSCMAAGNNVKGACTTRAQ